MIDRAVRLAGSGLGLGFLPVAPGTWGSLGGVLLWWATLPLGRWIQASLLILAIAPTVFVCGSCARKAGQEDPSFVVLDEILGMFLALLFISPSWGWVAAAFVLFRLLDIFKPWPVRSMEQHFSGGAAILLDDLVAGGIASIGLAAIQAVISNF